MKRLYFIVFFTSLVLTIVSCDRNRVYEENKEIPETGWDVNNKITFNVAIADTLSQNNFYVNVRNSDGYPYSNLFLFIKTDFPDGRSSLDTLECPLADDNGKWLGSGLGDIWDNQIPWKHGIRFPKPGTYVFTIEHAMRVEKLPLIMDVGLRIERAK